MDVYSFGVLLVELLVGEVPVGPRGSPCDLHAFAVGLRQPSCLDKVVSMQAPASSGPLEPPDSRLLTTFQRIAEHCLAPDHRHRPTMEAVHVKFSVLQRQLAKPIEVPPKTPTPKSQAKVKKPASPAFRLMP